MYCPIGIVINMFYEQREWCIVKQDGNKNRVRAQSRLNGNRTVSKAKVEAVRGAQGAARAPNE